MMNLVMKIKILCSENATSKQLAQVPLPDHTIHIPAIFNPLHSANPVAPVSMPNYVMPSTVTATMLSVYSDSNSD